MQQAGRQVAFAVDNALNFEREHILRVLQNSRWGIGGPDGAAIRLGMKRTTLQSKMQRLGISRS